MKLARFRVIIISIAFTTIAYSQQIFISKDYTENGQPVGTAYNKTVEKGKTYSMILNNGSKKFTQHVVFLFIGKQGSTNNFDIFSKLLLTDTTKNWVAFNYTFENDGTYDVFFTDFERNKIAQTIVSVGSKPKGIVERFSAGETRPSLQILFYEKYLGGQPLNRRTFVSIEKDKGAISICLNDVKPFGFNTLLINIWRRKSNGAAYDDFVDTKKYQIDSSWSDTHFKYIFKEPGSYKINVFDEKEILLKSAYISVTK